MKARIKTTGEVKDLTLHENNGKQWLKDEEDNVYDLSEVTLAFEETDRQASGAENFIKSLKDNAKNDFWLHVRLEFVRMFIQIYQAPHSNMHKILRLADDYVTELKKCEENRW